MATILNTRLTNAFGNDAFHLPVIEIQPIAVDSTAIVDFDYCIFLSANAVKHFCNAVFFHPRSFCIAIGHATKTALIEKGYKKIILPSIFNSEGLLALPELQQVENKSIVIIAGENPRPLLRETLIARGAHIKTIFCYKRQPIAYDMNIIFQKLMQHNIKRIVCASSESFFYLMTLFQQPAHHAWLLQKEIHVIGDKMKMEAKTAGFVRVKIWI